MGLLKSALVIGGIGYAANEIAKGSSGNRSANVNQKEGKPTIDTQAVVKAIRENPDLLALVRGEKGDAGNGYKATSTSSTAIATGSKSFDVGTPNLAYSVGARVRITATSDITKFMEGVVTAYSGNTLTVNVDAVSGSGTLASWNLNVAGVAGIQGDAGDSYRAFANSLVKNGAAELNTAAGWADAVLGVVHEGLFSLDFVNSASKNCLNSNAFHIDNRRLLKITCNAKTTAGNFGFYIKRLDKDGVAISQNNQANIFPLNTINHNNTSWAQKVAYFGGIGTASQTEIGINTAKGQVSLYTSMAATLSISHLCVEHVSLGEPVPYNLAYLPTNQMVYDPTTSEVGIYNGTTVIWFAA